MEELNFANMPKIFWVCVIILSFLATILIFFIVQTIANILTKKNLKTKLLDLTEPVKPEIKEKYIAEGKDLIDNQSQVTKLMLKSGRIRIYQTGLSEFNFKSTQEKIIFELLTFRLQDRINYEVKNDLTRNHITNKTDFELEQYSRSKSKAYYSLIKEKLFLYQEKLPGYDLPIILEKFSQEEFFKFFKDIYFSARGLANKTEGK